MANKLLKWALKQTDVKGAAKCVLIVLAIHADKKTQQCSPSLTEISDDAGVDRATVAGCARQLVDMKKITCEKRTTYRTVYTLSLVASGNQSSRPRQPALVASDDHEQMSVVVLDNQRQREEKKVIKEKKRKSFPLPLHNSNPVVSRRTKKNRPTTVAEDFSISDDMREWANAEGFDNYAIERETAAMVDHFRGSGKPKLDWTAVWRNWLRNSRGRFNGNGNGRHQTKVDRTIENAQKLLRRLDQQDRRREQRGAERSDDGGLRGTIDLPFDGADGSGHDPHD